MYHTHTEIHNVLSTKISINLIIYLGRKCLLAILRYYASKLNK